MTFQAPSMASSRLAGIITGAVREADRVLFLAVEGFGKTTFGANAPSPIFITAEEGAAQIGVARFPVPERLADVYADIDTLAKEAHGYKTLVIDTLDALEPMVWNEVCKREGKKNIEELGYGKGYTMALYDWRELLAKLDGLRKTLGMEIILLSHVKAKNFSNPLGPDYTRYEPTINPQAATLFKGWPDTTLFGIFEEAAVEAATGREIKTVNAKGKAKGVASGRRVIKTERSAAWDAKNRYDLPNEILLPPDPALSYRAYADLREAFWAKKLGNYEDPQELYIQATFMANTLPDGEKKTTAIGYIETNKGNAINLKKAIARLEAQAA